jgi:hypothetical protein
MLDRLSMYSWVKGLTVNVGKSKVVVFNSGGAMGEPGRDPVITYNGGQLGVEPHFKYLGLVFHRSPNMVEMQEPWARALLGSSMRARRIARSFGVHNNVLAGLKLFQTFAFPSGMYGCQVWGTRFAHIDRIFDSAVSTRQMCALRCLLGVSRSSARWAVLSELGAKPYHYYWVKALVRFQEVIVQANSPLLIDVAKADALLARDELPGGQRCSTCWSAELADALSSIGDRAGRPEQGDSWADRVKQGLPLGCSPAVLDATLAAYDALAWSEYAGAQNLLRTAQLPQGVGRKLLTYYAYFKPAQPDQIPAYLKLDQELHEQIRQLARFRLSCHKLRVEIARYRRPPAAWADRTCTRCSSEHLATLPCSVDDEHHMIFECERLEALRNEVVEFTPGTRRFTPGVRTALNRAQGSVRRFMDCNPPHIVLHFVSRCMSILDAETPIDS